MGKESHTETHTKGQTHTQSHAISRGIFSEVLPTGNSCLFQQDSPYATIMFTALKEKLAKRRIVA